jgi:membrane protease YdiL (CAAX protease family)
MSDGATSISAFGADLRPGERSLWRFLATLGVGFGVFLAATVLAMAAAGVLFAALFGWPSPFAPGGLTGSLQRLVALSQSDGRSFASAMEILGLALATNVAPFFAFIGVAAAMGPGALRPLVTAAPRVRWRLLVTGFALACLIVGPLMLLDAWLDPKAGLPPLLSVSPLAGPRIIYVSASIAVLLPAAMGEEILFRGWLLRQMSNLTHRWAPLMFFNGALFAAAHLDFAPEAFLERWIMGAGFAYMTLRIGGVELSSGAHFANNFIIVILIEPITLKPSPNTGVDPGALVAAVALFAAYILIAEVAARWRPLRAWSGAGLADAPSPWLPALGPQPKGSGGPWG